MSSVGFSLLVLSTKLPSTSVTVPFFVPCSITVAPMIDSPFESSTRPVILNLPEALCVVDVPCCVPFTIIMWRSTILYVRLPLSFKILPISSASDCDFESSVTVLLRLMAFCEKSTDICVCFSIALMMDDTVVFVCDILITWFCPNVATDIDKHNASVTAVLLFFKVFIVVYQFYFVNRFINLSIQFNGVSVLFVLDASRCQSKHSKHIVYRLVLLEVHRIALIHVYSCCHTKLNVIMTLYCLEYLR